MIDDREQFERLLSERMDGALTPDQLAELDRAVAGRAEFADLARRYDRLQASLHRWRALPADIDWQGLSTRIRRSIGGQVEQPTSKSVDDLMQDAFGPMPEVDWSRLRQRISAAVREEAAATRTTRRSWSRAAKWTTMAGVPLAAAAAIAIAVWFPRSAAPTAPTAPAPIASMIVVSFETPEPAGQVKIAFDEKPYEGGPIEDEANGAAIANGPSQTVTRERVDEVVLY